MDIDPHPDCGGVTNPDVAHGHILGPDNTMTPGGSMGHPGLYDLDNSLIRFQPELRPLHGIMDINSESSCHRAMDPDMTPGSSLGWASQWS